MNYGGFRPSCNVVAPTCNAPVNIADKRYIIGSVDSNGQNLRLSPNPAHHLTLEDAAKEANRLVNLPDNTGAAAPRKFVIFEAVEIVELPPRPTNSVRVSLRDNKTTS